MNLCFAGEWDPATGTIGKLSGWVCLTPRLVTLSEDGVVAFPDTTRDGLFAVHCAVDVRESANGAVTVAVGWSGGYREFDLVSLGAAGPASLPPLVVRHRGPLPIIIRAVVDGDPGLWELYASAPFIGVP